MNNECNCEGWRKHMGHDGDLVFLKTWQCDQSWETAGSPEPFTFCPYCGKRLPENDTEES